MHFLVVLKRHRLPAPIESMTYPIGVFIYIGHTYAHQYDRVSLGNSKLQQLKNTDLSWLSNLSNEDSFGEISFI